MKILNKARSKFIILRVKGTGNEITFPQLPLKLSGRQHGIRSHSRNPLIACRALQKTLKDVVLFRICKDNWCLHASTGWLPNLALNTANSGTYRIRQRAHLSPLI